MGWQNVSIPIFNMPQSLITDVSLITENQQSVSIGGKITFYGARPQDCGFNLNTYVWGNNEGYALYAEQGSNTIKFRGFYNGSYSAALNIDCESDLTSDNRSYTYVCAIDEDTQLGYLGFIRTWESGGAIQSYAWFPGIVPAQGGSNAVYELIKGNIPVLYTWHSLEGLYGNQVSLGLSQIKDEYIGDGSAVNLAPDTNIERLTQASKMENIFANIGKDFVPIAYAGDNSIQARAYYNENDFYLYDELAFFMAGDDTTPVYSYHINTDYDKSYLQIIYDDDAEAARVSVIKDYIDNTCAYNQQSFDQTTEHNLWLWLQGNQDGDSDDPYGEGSDDDGGDNFGLTPEDPLPFPSKPTASGLATGLFTVYNPTDTELQYLADFLWDPDAIGVLEKLFTEPENAIIAFYMLPVAPDHTGNKQLKLANANVPNCTGVKYLTDGSDGSGRYKEINFGSFSLKPKFDSYLDFNPYTTLKIYLPYIGVQNLNVDEFMCPAQASGAIGKTGYNNTFTLKYRIDLVTGVVSAFILRNNNVRYQFTGKCGMTLPITGRNYDNAISGILTAVAGVATTVASGGATAPMVAGASATAAGTVSAMKERVYHSGNLSGEASIFAYDTPYLIITRPNIPESTKDTKKFVGLPSYKTQDTLSSFSGFTKVFDAHIDNVSCTDEEKNEILQLLKEGVII